MTKLTQLYLQIKTHLSTLFSTLLGHADPQPANNRVETVSETSTEPATE